MILGLLDEWGGAAAGRSTGLPTTPPRPTRIQAGPEVLETD